MTNTEINSMAPGATLWDQGEKGSVKGLHLRANADGSKTFFFYYRPRGSTKQRRPKIGSYGQITLTDARKLAKELEAKVTLGDDPQGKWAALRAELTVQELFDLTFKRHWDKPRFQRSGWAVQVQHFYDKHIKEPLGRMVLSDLKPSVIRQWHSTFEDRPVAGNRSLEVLSRMLTFAEEQEIRPLGTNPCKLVKGFPENKRDRYATPEEIQKVAQALEKRVETDPAPVAFIYLLMFSGTRPRVIERVTWDDLQEFQIENETYGVLTFFGKGTADSGSMERIVIPPQAMKALNRLPRIKGEPITGLRRVPHKFWRKVRAEAGCGDLWARDWRRTFATHGMSNGVSQGLIGELLNHKSTQTTKLYAKVVPDKRVEAVGDIAGYLQSIIDAKDLKPGLRLVERKA